MTIEVEKLTQFFDYDRTADAEALEKRDLNIDTITPIVRAAAADSLIEVGRELLNSPITDLLAEAWTTRQDLKRFADPQAYPPDQENEYPLVSHEISLKRNPQVEVIINGVSSGLKFTFELKLTLLVRGATLKIRGGRVIGARVGDFQGAGSFSCGDVTLAERKTANFRLPGAVSFGEGFAIP
ncbi:MAG TPA: hypothetical protein VG841_14210 [Caulobacterales bacterium]|nr:hypothetical protein [Caulobacterales bacterium]